MNIKIVGAKPLPVYAFIDALRKGHIVRRKCWMDKNLWIRICNESGFDRFGNAVKDHEATYMLAHGTNGYFHHLSQSRRDGACMGLEELWADDWIDGGFASPEDFEKLEKIYESYNWGG